MTFRDRIVLLVLALTTVCLGASASAATLELSGPAGARVFINDQSIGIFPLSGPLELDPGFYDISTSLPGYFPFEKTVYFETSEEWVRIHAILLPLKKSTAWRSNIVYAGLGQFYMGKKTKGWVFALTETGGLLVALAGEAQRLNYRNDYILYKDGYDTAINADEIATYRSKSETAYTNMEDMQSLRNTGLMIVGGAIILSVLDALFLFPATEIGPGSTPLQTGSSNPEASTGSDLFTSFHAGIRVGF